MKKIRLFFTAVMVMLCAGVLSAQNLTITGVVTDAETGAPVSFASVIVKGTTTGVSTDIDGNYSITAPSNAILQFSFMGYETAEIPVNGQAIINVTLNADAEVLEDAIVVGYGTAKKISSVVGSAASVSGSKLADRPAANAADALQGMVAGMQVLSSTGEPMSTVSMRIRGINSINSSSTPLFILDGTPVSSSVFLSLSPNDIESTVVLKDASSTAIYGSRAANGVVYITTKKGKRSEKATVQLRAQYGVSSVAQSKLKMLNTNQWFDYLSQVMPEQFASDAMKANLARAQKYGINTNWQDYFFNDAAPTWSVDLNISGATERTDYFISASVFDQDGTLRYSDMSRYSLRSNINVKANDWLKLGANMQLTYQEARTNGTSFQGGGGYSLTNPMGASLSTLPWISPYELVEDPVTGEWHWGAERDQYTENQQWSTYYLNSIQPSTENYARLNGNTYIELTPVKGLVLRAVQAVEAYDWRSKYQVFPEGPFITGGSASESFQRYYQFTLSNTAEYKFSIAQDHHFVLLAGQESIMNSTEAFGVSVSGITDIRQNNLSDGVAPYSAPSWSKSDIVYNSFFGRLSYDYADKYFIDATVRGDGSSLFGESGKWGVFYSIGGMWNISRENFMASASWIDDFRLKASWGTTGNSGLPYNYLAIGTVGSGTSYNGEVSWGIGNVSNPDLTWEVVRSLNIGLSARLFDFWNVSVEFYDKYTTNMLMEIPYSYTTGHSAGWGNIGEMQNTGIDIDLSFDIFRNQDWYINLSTNFNYNHNAITQLFATRDSYDLPDYLQSYRVGHAYGEFWMPLSAGVDPRDGYQMWYDLDGNKTKVFSEAYSNYTGKNRFAPVAGGVQFYLQWKNLGFSMDWSYVVGKYMVNNDRYFFDNPAQMLPSYNVSTAVYDMWTPDNTNARLPRFEATRYFDTLLLEDASFLRLKNIQITYSFPEKLIQKSGFIQGFRIYVTGRNLLTFTKFSGWDPEVDSNISVQNYPNSRQIVAGVEFTF